MNYAELTHLEKLSVFAYQNEARSGQETGRFEAYFNPESYQQRFENQYQGRSTAGINTSGRPARYMYSQTTIMSFTLILDVSGFRSDDWENVLPGQKGVYDQVKHFLQLTQEMDGSIHQPRFLKLRWGKMNFDCRLASAEITYSHFDRNGNPGRAEIDTVFIGDLNDSLRKRLENKQSPDLTHRKMVAAGDRLPFLTKKVYGDSKHFIRLAQANGLNHLRELEPGQELFFPPLPKSSDQEYYS